MRGWIGDVGADKQSMGDPGSPATRVSKASRTEEWG